MEQKVALITGSSDGIGKATAIALAEKGYTIHILGLNENKIADALKKVKQKNPKGSHKTYNVDLSTIAVNKQFLNKYIQENERLDVLILNANVLPQKPKLCNDGIDITFMVSHISRYLFSTQLDSLLSKTKNSRVIHIGGATMISNIMYDRLRKADYKPLKSTGMGFMAENLFVKFANKKQIVKTPHSFYEPGVVNTNTVKTQSVFVRAMSKMMGMIEPERAGEFVTNHILNTNEKEITSKFYNNKGEKKPKNVVIKGENDFENLVNFTNELIK